MKKNVPTSAFTLIELIVAMVLISIIMLGIVSINIAMVNTNADFGQRYSVRSQTQATLNHILNNAALGVGSINSDDEPILIGGSHGLTDPHTFCIHQPGGTGNNLINHASDIWLCYSWTNTPPTNPYQIKWCAENYGSVPDPRGASSCSTAGGNLIGAVTFLGSAFNITPGLTLSPLQFTAQITNCLNNSDATTCTAEGSSDQANNPSVTLSGNVIPLQASGG